MDTPHKHAKEIIAWANGKEIEYLDHLGIWIYTDTPSWHVRDLFRVKPEVIYPKTSMTLDRMERMWDDRKELCQVLFEIANEAIKQAVIDGDVAIVKRGK